MKGVTGRRRTLVGAGAGLAVAAAGIGVGAAYATSGPSSTTAASGRSGAAVRQVADSTTPSVAPTPGAGQGEGRGEHHRPPFRGRALRLGAAVEHGELVVKTKDGTRTVSVQHGAVQQASGTSLVVKSEDGTTWTYAVDDKTRVRKDGQKVAAGELKSGDEVRVFAVKQGDSRLARLVVDGRPPRPMPGGHDDGGPGNGGPAQGGAPGQPPAPGTTPSGLDGDLAQAWDVLGA